MKLLVGAASLLALTLFLTPVMAEDSEKSSAWPDVRPGRVRLALTRSGRGQLRARSDDPTAKPTDRRAPVVADLSHPNTSEPRRTST